MRRRGWTIHRKVPTAESIVETLAGLDIDIDDEGDIVFLPTLELRMVFEEAEAWNRLNGERARER